MRNEWLDQQLRSLRSAGKSKTGLAQAMGWASARVTEVINGQRRVQREDQAAVVKFYVGRRRGKVVLRQENPRGEIEFPETEVQALYLIIGVMRR